MECDGGNLNKSIVRWFGDVERMNGSVGNQPAVKSKKKMVRVIKEVFEEKE